MKRDLSILGQSKTLRTALAASLLLAMARPALADAAPVEEWGGPAGGEKRYLVRYDHGTANLAPWAGLALYITAEKIRVVQDKELIHEILPAQVTSFTHELRSPFNPAKATERVFNDTVGACSDLLTCPVLGAAGVVGAAGVGIASLFTPKETIVTLNWTEDGRDMTLAMRVAWYQRDFIMRALEKATGRKGNERVAGARPKNSAAPSALPHGQQRTSADAAATTADAGAAAPASSVPLAAPAAYTGAPGRAPQTFPGDPRGMIQRVELILDRRVQVGETVLEPGFYLLLMQERSTGAVVLAFVDDSVRGPAASRIAARAVVAADPGPANAEVQPIFADEEPLTRFRELRLPGRVLRFSS